tara:strand:+ start:53298 stop:53879 length:582 start_codon:yes stop_codon:yes gene_type:complete
MKNLLIVLGLAGMMIGCSAKTSENAEESKHSTVNHDANHAHHANNTQTVQKNDLTAVIDAYLTLKDALVKDDQKGAATAGSSLATTLGALDMSKFSADEQKALKEIIDVAKNHGEHISGSEIGHQREHFESLGKDIKDLIGIVGADRTLYHQYCPMYNNNQGGMWLSASEEIRNPLFGSKMLKCGKVEEVISL